MEVDDLIDDSITDRVVQVDDGDPDWEDLDGNESVSETNKTGKTKSDELLAKDVTPSHLNESETNKTDGSDKTKSDQLLDKVIIPSHLTLTYFKYDESKAAFICQLPRRSKKIRESDEVIICGASITSCELNGKNGSTNLGTRAGNRNRHIRDKHTDVYKVKNRYN